MLNTMKKMPICNTFIARKHLLISVTCTKIKIKKIFKLLGPWQQLSPESVAETARWESFRNVAMARTNERMHACTH